MTESIEKEPNQFNANAAFTVTAVGCAIASVLVVFIGMKSFSQITDGGMWAIATMSFGPGLLGIAVCFFIFLTARGAQGVALARSRYSPSMPPDAYREVRGN